MSQSNEKTFPLTGYYDHEYLQALVDSSGLTKQRIAANASMSPTSLDEVLDGTCPKFRTVFRVNHTLKGDPQRVFTPNFHRAVRKAEKKDGAVRTGRSGGVGRSKSASASAR